MPLRLVYLSLLYLDFFSHLPQMKGCHFVEEVRVLEKCACIPFYLFSFILPYIMLFKQMQSREISRMSIAALTHWNSHLVFAGKVFRNSLEVYWCSEHVRVIKGVRHLPQCTWSRYHWVHHNWWKVTWSESDATIYGNSTCLFDQEPGHFSSW